MKINSARDLSTAVTGLIIVSVRKIQILGTYSWVFVNKILADI